MGGEGGINHTKNFFLCFFNKTVFIWSRLTYKHFLKKFCVVKFSSGHIATELRAHLGVNLPKLGQLHFLVLFVIYRHIFAVIIFLTSLALIVISVH
jgi:hypothetical protein